MIVEALIGGATVCFITSLRFAKYVLQREDAFDEAWLKREDIRNAPRLTKEALTEKRRVLERDREEWAMVLGNPDAKRRQQATAAMAKIDQTLLAIADEQRE